MSIRAPLRRSIGTLATALAAPLALAYVLTPAGPALAQVSAPAAATPEPAATAAAAAAAAADADPDAEPPPAGYNPDGTQIRRRSETAVPLDGRVLEKGNRDPLPGVRVTLANKPPPKPGKAKEGAGKPPEPPDATPRIEPITVITDENGRFEFPDVEPGEYEVSLRSSLIRTSQSVEKLQAGKKTTVTYYAAKKGNPFEVVVRAEAVRKEVSEQVLSVQELKRIPGTQGDTIKAVQNLPGVARPPFGGGLLVVWGSSPNDTRVYADGVQIPRIFHFGGFRATINSEFVQDLTFRPGAYGADFGRGLGGLIDVGTRAPKADRIHGSVTLDLIDGSLTLEGPITKNLYFAIGARVSWISVFLPLFNRSNFQLSPFYWDYQAALRWRPSKNDVVDVLLFGSTDDLSARVENPDPATSVDIDTKNYFSRARIRWTHRFSPKTELMVMPSIGGDVFRADFGDGGAGGIPLKLDIQQLGYNLRADIRHRFSDWFLASGGVDFEGTRSSFDVLAPTGPATIGGALVPSVRDASVLHVVRTAPYAIARFEFFDRRLLISPQLRLETSYIRSYDGAVSRTLLSPEPRLLVSGQIIPRRWLLKAGVGVFSQLAQAQELNRTFGNPDLEAQFGTTYVAGTEIDPTATLSIQAQFFYKDLRTLVVTDPTTRYSNSGLGRIIGGDFLLRQRLWRGLFGWVAYTVSRSERKETPEVDWHLFRYDQTHILTLIASYKLPWWGLEVGMRFRYVTGNPATPVKGALRDTSSQNWTQVNGDPFSQRLPDFHQLDLRIDKTWTFNRWKLGLYLDIQNLYNQGNTETLVYGGRQLFQNDRITGIPFFPNIGLRADF